MLHDLMILYTLFFRMGAVTFGGGYAMLPSCGGKSSKTTSGWTRRPLWTITL